VIDTVAYVPRVESTRAWWGGRRLAAAAVAAAAVFVAAFLFRFNPLGGSLGGFDNDHFVRLLRSDMVLGGYQPLRDFADAELRGAWPSLGYELSALVQRLGGRTLLAEAYLTVGALAIAAALVFLLALDLSRRWLVALLATACVIASGPKLYNYEKVLLLAVAAVLIRLWLVKPSWGRLIGLSVLTTAAVLFRHDYGVYVAMGAVAAFVARGPWRIGPLAGRLAAYGAITAVLLVPSLVWVQNYAGVGTYLQATLSSVAGESARTEFRRPPFDMGAVSAAGNFTAVAYYAFWAVVPVAMLAAAWRRLRDGRLDVADLATGAALIVIAVMANVYFLRNNLEARFGDAVVPIALLGAWASGLVAHVHRPLVVRWTPRAVLVVMLGALFVTGEVAQELRASGLSDSWETVDRRFDATRAELAPLPPARWDNRSREEEGTLVAARYLAECTAPDDRVLLVTYAPEVPVFARRLFAGGQGTFGLNFYLSESDQQRAVARLRQESVPIVLGSFDDYEGEFVEDYWFVHEYVAAHYREAGALEVDGEPRFRVLVEAARQPHRTHPELGLPCFR
jgi:hypothetical protein